MELVYTHLQLHYNLLHINNLQVDPNAYTRSIGQSLTFAPTDDDSGSIQQEPVQDGTTLAQCGPILKVLENLSIPFCVMLYTDGHTNKQANKLR